LCLVPDDTKPAELFRVSCEGDEQKELWFKALQNAIHNVRRVSEAQASAFAYKKNKKTEAPAPAKTPAPVEKPADGRAGLLAVRAVLM
jgi:hypothetical protein